MPRTCLSVRTGRSLGRRSSDKSWRMLELAGTKGDLYFLQTSILTLLTSSLDGFSRVRSRSRISFEICSTTWLMSWTKTSVPIVLRVSGGASVIGETLTNEATTTSFKDAIRLNVAAVALSIFVGTQHEH